MTPEHNIARSQAPQHLCTDNRLGRKPKSIRGMRHSGTDAWRGAPALHELDASASLRRPAASFVSLTLPCLENPEGTSRQPAALFCPVVPGLQVFETRHGVRLPAQAILVVRVQNELPEGAGGLFLLGW